MTGLSAVIDNAYPLLDEAGNVVRNDAVAIVGKYNGLNLQFLFGLVFSPVAWLLGTSSQDLFIMGQLLGEKTILNEFFAYSSMGNVKSLMTPKSVIIATYALCGFANFASIGIQIGGIGSLAPNQKPTLAKFGLKALIGGTIACLLTACIAGILYEWTPILGPAAESMDGFVRGLFN